MLWWTDYVSLECVHCLVVLVRTIFTDPLPVSGPGQCRQSAWPGPPRRGDRRVSGGRETAGTCGERRAEAAAVAETESGVFPPPSPQHTVPTLSSFPNVTRVLSTHDSIVYLHIYAIDIYIISSQWWTWAWDKWDTGFRKTLTKWYLPSWILSSELHSCSSQSIMVRVGLTDLFDSFTGIRVVILWYDMSKIK